MDRKRIDEVKARMLERSSADLLAIWRANDRAEWAGEAFQAIQEILTERGEALPPQADFNPEQVRAQQVARSMDGWQKLNKNPVSWQGRIGRRDWLLAGFVPILLVIPMMSPGNLDKLAEYIHPIVIIVLIAAVWYVVAANSIKRAHDCKRSGFYWLWLFVPIAGFIAVFHFLFERGKWLEEQERQ